METTDDYNNFQSWDGPKLPYQMRGMCAVKAEENVYIIGGVSKCQMLQHTTQDYNDCEYNSNVVFKKVWIYDSMGFKDQHDYNDYQENFYEEGPSMEIGRYGHACGLMKNGYKSMIVAAGGWPATNTVEILDLTTNQWSSGMNFFFQSLTIV